MVKEIKKPSAKYWGYVKNYKANFGAKYCLHPEASVEKCDKKIINAHTVQRATSLLAIAEKGHVTQIQVNSHTLTSYGGPAPIEIGINKASTFTGLCKVHDDITFAELEKKPFIGSIEQCFLLGYRALLHELYKKNASAKTAQALYEIIDSQNLTRSFYEQKKEVIDSFSQGTQAAQNKLENLKEEWDYILLSRDYHRVRGAVVDFKKVPDIMTTSALFPLADFDGVPFSINVSKLADKEELPSLITFSIIATATGGSAVFCWLDSSDDVCARFIASLVGTRPGDRIDDAIVRFCFSTSENLYVRPSWWSQLSNAAQEVLLARTANLANLMADFADDEYTYDGLRYVDWGEVSRKLYVTVDGSRQEIFDDVYS